MGFSHHNFETLNTVSLFASPKLWLDDNAKQQLVQTSKLEHMLAVVGLPDLHLGKHAPIGAACLTHQYVYPALVGSDIGCGIGFWQTDIIKHRVNKEKLIKKWGNIDASADSFWLNETLTTSGYEQFIHSPFCSNLGTIGSGNHFAEITAIETLFNENYRQQLDPDFLYLLVHSGSRGLGQSIFEQYSHSSLPFALNGDKRKHYLRDHQHAYEYAMINRSVIAQRICAQLNTECKMLLNVAHNFVEKIGDEYFLHRKGAAPATQGLVVIAGSRGSYSYLVKPNAHLNSLYSIAHGAGRKWRRGDCKEKLTARYPHWENMLTTKQGNRVVCLNKSLAYEEAAEAYKNIDQVIECLVEHHLIDVVARLSPVITYKTMKTG